jgi:hypothetical protein
MLENNNENIPLRGEAKVPLSIGDQVDVASRTTPGCRIDISFLSLMPHWR